MQILIEEIYIYIIKIYSHVYILYLLIDPN